MGFGFGFHNYLIDTFFTRRLRFSGNKKNQQNTFDLHLNIAGGKFRN